MATSSSHAPTRRPIPASGVVPVVLGLVGALVAAAGSWHVSLWTDEAATISAARRTLGELGALVSHHDAVHALYYLFIHGWASLFGYSAFALRLPSAVAAGVAVAGVWVLAVRIGRRDAAVPAAIVAVVLPRITWMGIEARSFGPSAAVAVWATVLLVAAVERGRWRWAVYGALVALGIATNIYLALLVVAHLVTVLMLNVEWRRRGVWLVSAALGSIAASPVVVAAASQKGQLGDNTLGLATMLRQAVVNQWFLGATPTPVDGSDSGHSIWAIAALALALVAWVLIAVAVVAAIRGRSRAGAVGIAVTLPWILLPTLIAIAYSLAVSPLYNSRYFTFAAPAVALAVGLGIAALPMRVLRVIAVALVVVLAAPVYVSQRTVTAKSDADWSLVAAFVSRHDHGGAGQGIYFTPLEPTPDTAIGRTTRYIDVAYPGAFAGLRDVTLRTTPAQDATLRGTSFPLAASTKRLNGLRALWVIRPTGYPAGSAAADDALLDKAGLRPTSTRFAGPSTTVVEWRVD